MGDTPNPTKRGRGRPSGFVMTASRRSDGGRFGGTSQNKQRSEAGPDGLISFQAGRAYGMSSVSSRSSRRSP